MKKRRRWRTAITPSLHQRLVALFAAGICGLVSAAAQSTAAPPQQQSAKPQSTGAPYALIFVTAYDPAGHGAYALEVKIRRADKKKSWSGFTDHSGEFAQRVPPAPGDYLVWLETSKKKADRQALSAAISGAEKGKAHTVEEGAVRGESAVKIHINADERIDIGFHPK